VRVWRCRAAVFPKKNGKGIQRSFPEKYRRRFPLLDYSAGRRRLSAPDAIQRSDALALSVLLPGRFCADSGNIKIRGMQVLRNKSRLPLDVLTVYRAPEGA